MKTGFENLVNAIQKNKSSLEEEQLAEEARKCPCLYNEGSQRCKEQDWKKNGCFRGREYP